MIVTKLQGGLGNQLFQWATTFSLSKKYNSKYFFEFSYFHLNARPFQLDKFPLIDAPLLNEVCRLNLIRDDFLFKEIPDNSFLDGYWQSEKYFKQHSDEIRKILSLTKEKEIQIKNKYPILNEQCTSIHVRRGDYLGFQNIHPIQLIEYYEKALSLCKQNHVLIFSDDINWCKSNFKGDKVYHIDEKEEVLVMDMMSLCKNNIIANSSFSWWGAWKGIQEQRKVICPKNWFGPGGFKNWSDIYCENWTIL